MEANSLDVDSSMKYDLEDIGRVIDPTNRYNI